MEKTTLEKWIRNKIGQSQITTENLKDYQLKKIKETCSYAKANSSFYRALYDGIQTEKIDWDNFCNLPFTTAEDIKQSGKKMVCVEQDKIHRIVTLPTSGTTDKPKRIYFTEDDQELTIDFFCNGMQILTKPQDNVAIFLPAQTPGCVGDLLARGLERFGAIPHRYGIPDDFDKALKYMFENNISVAVANPEQILAIGSLAKSKNIKLNMKSILLSTDFVADSLIKQVENCFGAKVYEHYGMTETGLGGGVSCQSLYGYHMREADLFFEVIDPETEQPLPDGCFGEIVFTTLTRKAMPLIRYKTGDYGRFLTEPCPCGTILKRMGKVYHRIDQSSFKITDFDEAVFSINGIFNYDICIDKENKIIEIAAYTLENNPNLPHMIQSQTKNISQGYDIKVIIKKGFKKEHYMLKKRKIEYTNIY